MFNKLMNSHYKAILFLLSVLLASCAASTGSVPRATSVSKQTSFSAQTPEYEISAGDQLDIKFFYNPEMNEQVLVRPDGRISLQLVHEIIAAGLTPAELTNVLTKKYAKELDKPEITVIVRSFGGQRVYVDGEVNKPGIVNLTTPLTVLQSLAEAGGVKDTARLSEILVIRRGPGTKPMALVMNMEKVVDGTEMSRDLYLMPNDIVYVPRSRIANVNLWMDQYIRKNIPISLGAGVYYNYTPHP
jgi:protein involved in polysaccharide export with SLBB domain